MSGLGLGNSSIGSSMVSTFESCEQLTRISINIKEFITCFLPSNIITNITEQEIQQILHVKEKKRTAQRS